MNFRFAGLTLLVAASPILAHDFWLQPLRFQTQPGTPFAMTFQIGHGALRQRWGSNERIVALNDLLPGARRDLRADLKNGGPADIVTQFERPGLHVLAMQTNFAASDLPAIRFNDYAKAEGLALVIATRASAGTADRAGRERYSRRAKALVQVGAQTPANQALATRSIGFKLEIVPLRNPYALGTNRQLPVRVLYKGKPLPNAMVKLTSLEFDARPVAVIVTDRAGVANFRVPGVGEWLLNVIWSEPVRGDPAVDFDTTFSSLTFGYNPAMRPR